MPFVSSFGGKYNLNKKFIILISLAFLCVLFGMFGCGNNRKENMPEEHGYSISYNLDGGTFSSEELKEYRKSDDEIKLPSATKTGYNFIGWLDESGETVKALPRNSTGDKKLKAVWEIKTYKIIFNNESPSDLTAWVDDGGFGERVVYVKYGETINAPKIKNDERTAQVGDDYSFKYWYYIDNNGKKIPVDTGKPFLTDTSDTVYLFVFVVSQWVGPF